MSNYRALEIKKGVAEGAKSHTGTTRPTDFVNVLFSEGWLDGRMGWWIHGLLREWVGGRVEEWIANEHMENI